jgi:hypothetical protein
MDSVSEVMMVVMVVVGSTQWSTCCGRGYYPYGGFRGWGVPFSDHTKRPPHPRVEWNNEWSLTYRLLENSGSRKQLSQWSDSSLKLHAHNYKVGDLVLYQNYRSIVKVESP